MQVFFLRYGNRTVPVASYRVSDCFGNTSFPLYGRYNHRHMADETNRRKQRMVWKKWLEKVYLRLLQLYLYSPEIKSAL